MPPRAIPCHRAPSRAITCHRVPPRATTCHHDVPSCFAPRTSHRPPHAASHLPRPPDVPPSRSQVLRADDGVETVVSSLKPGAYFGERALLVDVPCAATPTTAPSCDAQRPLWLKSVAAPCCTRIRSDRPTCDHPTVTWWPQENRYATVRAVEDCRTLAISRTAFESAFGSSLGELMQFESPDPHNPGRFLLCAHSSLGSLSSVMGCLRCHSNCGRRHLRRDSRRGLLALETDGPRSCIAIAARCPVRSTTSRRPSTLPPPAARALSVIRWPSSWAASAPAEAPVDPQSKPRSQHPRACRRTDHVFPDQTCCSEHASAVLHTSIRPRFSSPYQITSHTSEASPVHHLSYRVVPHFSCARHNSALANHICCREACVAVGMRDRSSEIFADVCVLCSTALQNQTAIKRTSVLVAYGTVVNIQT